MHFIQFRGWGNPPFSHLAEVCGEHFSENFVCEIFSWRVSDSITNCRKIQHRTCAVVVLIKHEQIIERNKGWSKSFYVFRLFWHHCRFLVCWCAQKTTLPGLFDSQIQLNRQEEHGMEYEMQFSNILPCGSIVHYASGIICYAIVVIRSHCFHSELIKPIGLNLLVYCFGFHKWTKECLPWCSLYWLWWIDRDRVLNECGRSQEHGQVHEQQYRS